MKEVTGNEDRVELVAQAIWEERVRAAKANGIDLEGWLETTGLRNPEGSEVTVARMNNIMGEASAAVKAYDLWLDMNGRG